jgi:hypothetical protein
LFTELPWRVQSVTTREALVLLAMPPPLVNGIPGAMLFWKVEPVTLITARFSIPPPEPKTELFRKVQLSTIAVPLLKRPPPLESALLARKAVLLTVSVPVL